MPFSSRNVLIAAVEMAGACWPRRGDQGLGGRASRGRGEDDNAKTLVPDDVTVELEQA